MANFLASEKKNLEYKHNSDKIEKIMDSHGKISELVYPDDKIEEISNPNINLQPSPHNLLQSKKTENFSQSIPEQANQTCSILKPESTWQGM